jgi:undecaprenyl-diphosphatase
MDWVQIVVLAVVQALTEFLPISSSAHLYLIGVLLGWGYQGLVFDLGVHLGTLIAVLVYFRRDWQALLAGAVSWRPRWALDGDQRLLGAILLGTVPAGLAGLWLGEAGADALRRFDVIGSTLIVFGLLLWVADRVYGGQRGERDVSLRQGLLIGCAQALALVPGVSRSGACMTAALFLGLSREAAARFAFLLSAPITALASAKGVVDLIQGSGSAARLDVESFLLGVLCAAVAGWLCIHAFLGLVRRIGMGPFVAYRLLLGSYVLWLAAHGAP